MQTVSYFLLSSQYEVAKKIHIPDAQGLFLANRIGTKKFHVVNKIEQIAVQ